MLKPLLAGLTSFVVAYTFLPFVIRFSKKKKFVAVPDQRRIHKRVTPSLGGVAIFLGFTLGTLCWSEQAQWPHTLFLLPILIIPFILGLLDDLIHLTPVAKLIGQFITSSLIFFILDIRLNSFYGLAGDFQIPYVVSYGITLLTVVVITNSLNLIDGIDGLAATFSFIAALFFGSWFFFTGVSEYAIVCFALCGGIVAFLFQNWEPSKIFMGDTGSMVIGTSLSIIMIHFINHNYGLEEDHPLKFRGSIATALSVMIIPIMDTTRIIIIRLYKNISPFHADKRHIHHALVRLDLTHRQVVYILAIVQVFFISLAILLRRVNEWYLIGAILFIATLLCILLEKIFRKFLSKTGKIMNPNKIRLE
jgi:UDP-GlcNAc:undecaprenyl-phosphate/decaprenyl-phosphate GlcNAc-1-phosphate transferase